MGMMGILKSKLPPSPTVYRKVLLEGQRIGAPEALALGIVDDLASDGEGVVAKAHELAGKIGGKASAGAWGLIKAGLYKDALSDMALDRGNDGLGFSAKL
jgi:enoyl-CoA hydratase/carnithine racemase